VLRVQNELRAGTHVTSPLASAMATSRRQTVVAYAAFVIVPILGLLLVLRWGQSLPAISVGEASTAGGARATVLNLPLFLIQIVVIVAMARGIGAVLRRVGQPAVVGEMVAGLALGPSVLGYFVPAAYGWLFPLGTVRY